MAGSIVRRDTLNEVSPWRQDTFMSFYKMNRLPRGSVRWENFYRGLAEKLRQLVGTCFLAETNKFKSSGVPTEVIFRIRSVVLCTHPEGRQGRDGRGVCVCVCVCVHACAYLCPFYWLIHLIHVFWVLIMHSAQGLDIWLWAKILSINW